MIGIRSLHAVRMSHWAQRGLSLVEVSIVLVIAGLMSWAAFMGYETVSAQQEIERGRAEAQQLQSVVRSFALRHGRLPCPDVVGTGYESLTGLQCSPGTQLGWFPYVSAGLSVPTDRLRARYAVFRKADAVVDKDADLAATLERSGDAADADTHEDVTDLIVALNNASRLAVDASRPYITGDGGAGGAIDCATNLLMGVAYWVVVPLQDRDNDGSRLDPPHAMNSLCATNPSAPLRRLSDDVVVAESPIQLAGWLRSSLP